MPTSYVIRPSSRRVDCVASGKFTDTEFRKAAEDVRNDPHFDPTFSQLFDLSAVTEFALSNSILKGLSMTSIFSPDAPRAIVALDDLGYGLARMHALWKESRSGTPIAVFRNRTEAIKWLETKQSELGPHDTKKRKTK